ncbi:MAG TPA: DUF4193 family protein [Acidimicrobiia bacterium]|nr:DUF4193 family protein [Acidimicrobiia bacterium]
MAEDEFDEEEPELDDDELDLDDDEDDEDLALADEDDDEIDVDVIEDDTAEETEIEVPTSPAALTTTEEEDDEIVDLDEELHPDDVEEPLDVLLLERTASGTLEDDEELEDEEAETDERGDGSGRILPRRADEFLCSSCFLVLPRTQLADEAKMVCRDCA